MIEVLSEACGNGRAQACEVLADLRIVEVGTVLMTGAITLTAVALIVALIERINAWRDPY